MVIRFVRGLLGGLVILAGELAVAAGSAILGSDAPVFRHALDPDEEDEAHHEGVIPSVHLSERAKEMIREGAAAAPSSTVVEPEDPPRGSFAARVADVHTSALGEMIDVALPGVGA